MSNTGLSAAALPATLLEWSFSPWTRALQPDLLPQAVGLMAQRDDYRDWCRRHGIPADFPVRYEAAWQSAALSSSDELVHCAALYGGLFAARERDRVSLAQLPGAAQRWCLKVALTQPLLALVPTPCSSVRQRGLGELALHLERSFPGMWPRLALMLPQDTAQTLQQMCRAGSVTAAAHAEQRALRCWMLCVEQARGVGLNQS